MIDLSSDTATKPTPEMRSYMAAAPVGDEQRREDPTVNELQEMAAELTGKEAALFLPSGTMCNAIAFAVHCRPGAKKEIQSRAKPRRPPLLRPLLQIFRRGVLHGILHV